VNDSEAPFPPGRPQDPFFSAPHLLFPLLFPQEFLRPCICYKSNSFYGFSPVAIPRPLRRPPQPPLCRPPFLFFFCKSGRANLHLTLTFNGFCRKIFFSAHFSIQVALSQCGFLIGVPGAPNPLAKLGQPLTSLLKALQKLRRHIVFSVQSLSDISPLEICLR